MNEIPAKRERVGGRKNKTTTTTLMRWKKGLSNIWISYELIYGFSWACNVRASHTHHAKIYIYILWICVCTRAFQIKHKYQLFVHRGFFFWLSSFSCWFVHFSYLPALMMGTGSPSVSHPKWLCSLLIWHWLLVTNSFFFSFFLVSFNWFAFMWFHICCPEKRMHQMPCTELRTPKWQHFSLDGLCLKHSVHWFIRISHCINFHSTMPFRFPIFTEKYKNVSLLMFVT